MGGCCLRALSKRNQADNGRISTFAAALDLDLDLDLEPVHFISSSHSSNSAFLIAKFNIRLSCLPSLSHTYHFRAIPVRPLSCLIPDRRRRQHTWLAQMATSVPENDIFSVTEVRTGFLNTDTDSLDQHAHQFSVSPNAPYTNGPPSPPLIPVPVPGRGRESRPFVELVPKSTNLANTPGLRCVHEIAHEGSEDWNYEQRWTAQPIVDGLYLGPS